MVLTSFHRNIPFGWSVSKHLVSHRLHFRFQFFPGGGSQGGNRPRPRQQQESAEQLSEFRQLMDPYLRWAVMASLGSVRLFVLLLCAAAVV